MPQFKVPSPIPSAIRKRSLKMTPEQFMQHARELPMLLDVKVFDFTVAMAHKAQDTFRRSFGNQGFYSAGAPRWQPLTAYTMRKRAWHGTLKSNPILREYGVLRDSIKVKESKSLESMGHVITQTVWTDPLVFSRSRYHRGFVYAGVHNNPSIGDTYGKWFGGKQAKQRQFMGHSTYVDDWQEKYVRNYLFDSIFG